MNLPNFETNISTVAIPGASEQFARDAQQYKNTWAAGEAVPSTYYEVGSFVMAPCTLESLEDDLSSLEQSQEIYTIPPDMDYPDEAWLTPPVSHTLKQFMLTVGRKLRSFAAQDAGVETSDPGIFTYGMVGPYDQQKSAALWHRDLIRNVGDRNYVVTLLGPTTEFAVGDFKESDFEYEQLLPQTPIPKIESAKPSVITLFDRTIAVHESPGDPAVAGQPRIFFTCTIPSTIVKR